MPDGDTQPPPLRPAAVSFAPGPPTVAPSSSRALLHSSSTASAAALDPARARAHEALAILLEGNDRFASGAPLLRARADAGLLADLASEEQPPLAAVLACCDARCPPELLFDAGVGDLHVVRVAGGALDPVMVDSMVAAVTELGARLVVVLGHTSCSAVRRAIKRFVQKEERGATAAAAAAADTTTPSPPSSAGPPPPSLLARAAAACGCAAPPAVSVAHHRSAVTPRASSGRSSADRSVGSGLEAFLARASATPLAAVSDALAGAVAAVAKARGGRLAEPEAPIALDDAAAARRLALRSQDSLSLNHARLARAKLKAAAEAAAEEEGEEGDARRGGVDDDVVAEHVKRSAAALLAAVAARADPAVAREVEVVGARVDLGSGRVAVLRRAWLGVRGPLFEG